MGDRKQQHERRELGSKTNLTNQVQLHTPIILTNREAKAAAATSPTDFNCPSQALTKKRLKVYCLETVKHNIQGLEKLGIAKSRKMY